MAVSYAARLKKNYDYGPCGLPEKVDPERVRTYKLKQICALIDKSKYIVVHTGAGISTASRIPDFRGPRGIWTLELKQKYKQRQLEREKKANKDSEANGEQKTKRKRRNPWEERLLPQPASISDSSASGGDSDSNTEAPSDIPWAEAKPSLTHMALAALVKTGKVKAIITQNVDGLHTKSGVPDRYLMELHGNVFKEKCEDCGKVYIRDFDVGGIDMQRTGRLCERRGCKGYLRDCLLDWDSELPEDQFLAAEKHSKKADLCICLGTSLRVRPANTLPVLTKQNGGALVIINLQETLLDPLANVKLHDYTDNAMKYIMDHLRMRIPEYGEKWSVRSLFISKKRKRTDSDSNDSSDEDSESDSENVSESKEKETQDDGASNTNSASLSCNSSAVDLSASFSTTTNDSSTTNVNAPDSPANVSIDSVLLPDGTPIKAAPDTLDETANDEPPPKKIKLEENCDTEAPAVV